MMYYDRMLLWKRKICSNAQSSSDALNIKRPLPAALHLGIPEFKSPSRSQVENSTALNCDFDYSAKDNNY